MPETIVLPARLDTAASDALGQTLQEHAGTDLNLDGSRVEHLGALCLELLLSARHIWNARGHDLGVVDPSPALGSAIALSGATAFGLLEDAE